MPICHQAAPYWAQNILLSRALGQRVGPPAVTTYCLLTSQQASSEAQCLL